MEWINDVYWLKKVGVLLFFLVPLILVFIGIAFVRRETIWDKLFVFVAGSDNRLSLSRLQAFLWTLVIFGSFFAAMSVHKKIDPNTQVLADEAKIEAETAAKKVETVKTELELAKTQAETALKEKNKADSDLTAAQNKLKALGEKPTDEQKKPVQDEIDQRQKELNLKTTQLSDANTKLNNAETAFNEATKSAQTKRETADLRAEDARKNNWVVIPGALLALTGIAIGSGVFSSLISTLNSEEKTACITNITKIPDGDFNKKDNEFKDTAIVKSDNLLMITGRDLGSSGKVRLGKGKTSSVYVPIVFWRSNGTQIIVDVPKGKEYDTLVVDTSNGKLSHNLEKWYPVKSSLTDEEKQKIKDADEAKKARDVKEKELADAKIELDKLNADPITAADVKNVAQIKFDSTLETLKNLNIILTAKENEAFEIKNSMPGAAGNLKLGSFVYYYEFSDLFRDDKNPGSMDLMKFQMFGWTAVAVFIYSWLFLSNLNAQINTLPLVPESIVLLTGLSQAGYLAGKGISNMTPNEPKKTP